jgi:DNA-binding NarL/FixJ family response regulator
MADAAASPLSYWGVDLRNRAANNAHVDWFGVEPEDMLGRHLRHVLGRELYERERPFVVAALHGVPQVFTRSVTRLSETVPAEVRYLPDIVGGRVVGFCAALRDLTATTEPGAASSAAPAVPRARVVVSHGDSLVRMGIEAVLRGAPEIDVVGAAASVDGALEEVREKRPDVVVVDPRLVGFEQLLDARRAAARESAPFPRLVVLTASLFDDYLFDLGRTGVTRLLTRHASSDELVAAVCDRRRDDLRACTASRVQSPATTDPLVWPTRREREVIGFVLRGYSNAQVAQRLCIHSRP